MSFELEHKIVAKRERMEELIARHNHLVSLLPKELNQEQVPEFQVTLAEIDKNMAELLAVVEELKNDCERSSYFREE
ncbi:MAG: hypothetical protein ACXWNQ_03545 [Anaerolineales bacterium]